MVKDFNVNTGFFDHRQTSFNKNAFRCKNIHADFAKIFRERFDHEANPEKTSPFTLSRRAIGGVKRRFHEKQASEDDSKLRWNNEISREIKTGHVQIYFTFRNCSKADWESLTTATFGDLRPASNIGR